VIGLVLLGCASPVGDSAAPPPYPETYTPETDLKDYELVRVETETWRPLEDPVETALYIQKAAYHRKGAPTESLDHFAAMQEQLPPLGDGLRLTFAGDAMWVGGNWAHVFDAVADRFDGDLSALNVETPTSPDLPTHQGALGIYAFNADPTYLDGLPVQAVQLNNNHALDGGEEGLTASLAEVDARGLTRTGIDQHAVVDVAGKRVALLSFTWGINAQVTPQRELFIVPFGHGGDVDLTPVFDAIEAVEADFVVVMPHWGYEYEYYPDPHFMVQARQIIAAGADLVVGSGPHVVQPPELCHVNQGGTPGVGACAIEADGPPRDAAVFYRLGNAATVMSTLPCQVGVAATVSLGEGGVTGLGWAPLVSHPDVPDVEPPDPGNAEEAAEIERLRAHLGEGWERGEGE